MSFIKNFFSWVGGLFKKASDAIETVVLPVAIVVTNALKSVLNADTPDIIGHLAGSAGAALEDKLRALINQIVPKLQLAQSFKGQDPATILANILKLISPAEKVTQTAFWIEFSGMLTNAWEDGKIDPAEAAAMIKYYYDNHPAVPVAPTPGNPLDATV